MAWSNTTVNVTVDPASNSEIVGRLEVMLVTIGLAILFSDLEFDWSAVLAVSFIQITVVLGVTRVGSLNNRRTF